MVKDAKSPPPANDAITGQFELILTNSDFDATPQQIALLKYVVNQTLAGKAREITDDTLAAEVFGRGPGTTTAVSTPS